MLVLTRKVGEAICLGGDIVVRVTAIDGGRVRIGIDAPRDIKIIREELRVKPTVPTGDFDLPAER